PESANVFTHHQSQGRRRRAPGRDWIAGQCAKSGNGVKFAGRINAENARAHVPWTKEARPSRLGPTGVGEIPMNIVWLAAEPLLAGDTVPQAVALLRMEHHFRRSGRAAGEVNDTGVFTMSRLRFEIGRYAAQFTFQFLRQKADPM